MKIIEVCNLLEDFIYFLLFIYLNNYLTSIFTIVRNRQTSEHNKMKKHVAAAYKKIYSVSLPNFFWKKSPWLGSLKLLDHKNNSLSFRLKLLQIFDIASNNSSIPSIENS